MKTVKTVVLLASFLIVVCCGKQENQTPRMDLHLAALQGNVDAIQLHIKAGSDLNEKDDYGSTPLIAAITFGQTETAKALIEADADLRLTNNEGSTPLHLAAFFCHPEIVKALLDKGADKNLKNNTGSTALEIVLVPFEDIKFVYDNIGEALKPVGLRLDYDRIQETRPKITEMLR
ncbi:ankyrin repeat domain-containing protein [Acidobacteriota bacterium]